MAKMFPTFYPRVPNPDDPEFAVFEILRKLPDAYSVFYSRKFKGTKGHREEAELDFIVFDGRDVLLCLEVKGGMIRYDGAEDCWFQNGNRIRTSPDRQASAGMHTALSYLGPDAKNLNVGWALGFPHCCLPRNLQPPAGLPEIVLIDQEKFNTIEPTIREVGRYYQNRFGRPGVSSATADSIGKRLTHGMCFVSKVGVRIARDYQQIVEVTDEQMRILEDLDINERMVIRGFAGTGKTVIATEFARRLAEQKKSVLFLFYNRLLAKKVSRSFDRGSSVRCTRFFKLAKSLIDASDQGWWKNNDDKSEGFWINDVPLRLLDLCEEDLEKFDAIVVDEGQDFKPEWFEFLERLLKDREDSRFVAFYDDNQDVFGRWADLPWGGRGAGRKLLKENCRNTKAIIDYLNDHHSSEMVPFNRSPQGERVVERLVRDVDEFERLLHQDIESLLKNDVSPGQIVVLFGEPKGDSMLADIHAFGKMKFEAISRYYDERAHCIQFTTINMFKGLEADVVFAVVPDNSDSETPDKSLYTLGSRARVLLYVYHQRFAIVKRGIDE